MDTLEEYIKSDEADKTYADEYLYDDEEDDEPETLEKVEKVDLNEESTGQTVPIKETNISIENAPQDLTVP